MRKLVSIRVIDDVQPIPGADRIEKIRLGGWWCVVGKEYNFKPGDACIYHEIDSLLPIREPYLFLQKNCAVAQTLLENGVIHEGLKLRTMSFRGMTSQGLALPLSAFPGLSAAIGDDVTDLLGVVKYERIPTENDLSQDIAGNFPGNLRKTDLERIQNSLVLLDLYRGRSFWESEKLDGNSTTFAKYDKIFDTYQKTIRLKPYSENVFWMLAQKYGLPEKLPDNYAIQAETIGPGVDNKLGLGEVDCFVFRVYDIQKAVFLSLSEMQGFVNDLGMKMVPIISPNFILNHSWEELLEQANRKSLLNPKHNAEGIIFRLNDQEDICFKVVSNKYLDSEK
jgi:RNA ligase (TIGR02306 family)